MVEKVHVTYKGDSKKYKLMYVTYDQSQYFSKDVSKKLFKELKLDE